MTAGFKLVSLLKLVRPELVLPLIGNSWLMVCMAFHLEPEGYRNPQLLALGLPVSLMLAAMVTAGMSIYALSTNDMLGFRRDRSPHATGSADMMATRLGTPALLVMTILSLSLAMIAAILLGRESALLAIVAATGILFYNVMGKHMPAAGIVTLGLITALNMLIVSPQMGFAWPVWLSMSHVMIVATVLHGLQGKLPRLRGIDLAGIFAGWLFWTMALFAWMTLRDTTMRHDLPWVWVGPGAAAAIYVAMSIGALTGPRSKAGGRYAMASLLAMLLFDAGWLVALGLPRLALLLMGSLLVLLGVCRLLQASRLYPTDLRLEYGVDSSTHAP